MGYECVFLFEGYLVIAIYQLHTLNLPVGGRNHYLTTYTAYPLNKQFKNGHNLPDGQFVKCKISKSFLVYPQTKSFSGKAIYEFGTGEQLANYESKQFGIAFAIDTATLCSGSEIPEIHTFLKSYLLLGSVGFCLTQELLLTTTSRK